jgi:hypothetical protein
MIIFTNKQGVKHWRYFSVCDEQVKEETPFQCWCKKKKGSIFAKCNVCESLKDLISKLGKNRNNVIKYA